MQAIWKKYSYAIILFTLTLCFGFASLILFSDEEHAYKEIKVEDGDSLWSIAHHYSDEKNMSIDEFISWVQTKNQLKSNVIKAGDEIVIPVEVNNDINTQTFKSELALNGN
ncbi:cell division suppressor protein YneA [Falsibacillus albus]|nr:LysM peptidoglycan-binding domain-containing protein [Falsibacillus albus]